MCVCVISRFFSSWFLASFPTSCFWVSFPFRSRSSSSRLIWFSSCSTVFWWFYLIFPPRFFPLSLLNQLFLGGLKSHSLLFVFFYCYRVEKLPKKAHSNDWIKKFVSLKCDLHSATSSVSLLFWFAQFLFFVLFWKLTQPLDSYRQTMVRTYGTLRFGFKNLPFVVLVSLKFHASPKYICFI